VSAGCILDARSGWNDLYLLQSPFLLFHCLHPRGKPRSTRSKTNPTQLRSIQHQHPQSTIRATHHATQRTDTFLTILSSYLVTSITLTQVFRANKTQSQLPTAAAIWPSDRIADQPCLSPFIHLQKPQLRRPTIPITSHRFLSVGIGERNHRSGILRVLL
jgi:hypothetical protein